MLAPKKEKNLRKRKNKKSMSLSITLLVFGTLILSMLSLYTFITREKNLREEFYIFNLEEVYFKEDLINFFILEIIKKANENYRNIKVDIPGILDIPLGGEEVTEEKNKQINEISESLFISEFKKELENYKVDGKFIPEELSQIENQLDKIKFDLEKDRFSLNLTIKIEKTFTNKNNQYNKKGNFKVIYSYNKIFECEKENCRIKN